MTDFFFFLERRKRAIENHRLNFYIRVAVRSEATQIRLRSESQDIVRYFFYRFRHMFWKRQY